MAVSSWIVTLHSASREPRPVTKATAGPVFLLSIWLPGWGVGWIKWEIGIDIYALLHKVQFSSIPQSCPTFCDPMNCSTPGLPVHHQLPESTQTHVHWFADAIQPSHPVSSPSPPALNLSQHQSLFQWVNSSHEVAKVLEFQLQHQSFQWSPLRWTGWISLQSKGLSRVFSNTTVQKHQFFSTYVSL